MTTTTIPHTIQSQIIRECLLECNTKSLPTNSHGLQYVCKRWFQLVSHQPRTILVNEHNVEKFLTTLERMQCIVGTTTTTDDQDCWNLAKNVTYLIWDADTLGMDDEIEEEKEMKGRICRLLHNCPTITHIKTNHRSLSLFEVDDCLPKTLVHFAAEADQDSFYVRDCSRLACVYDQLAKCPSLVSVDIGIFSRLCRDPMEMEKHFNQFLDKKIVVVVVVVQSNDTHQL
ncbi:hypothetical protein DFA_12314 [Cavenderia fasciculata]|uniref:F-box domain-containing protein n=1 Tax=Cavenderia fasciculata TaxID=261658 RepID=F4QD67_CACFS|nr:uncharacterized protein DFA_12314 [Cavenderia fasciculata]EGG14538.1 hypothetical protein DFA_12314 [Cavenderia fasciculata]|eukprot:XP_004353979.1 hypothetical protein DFA_12314 [Cavenderia fasciculata]